MTAVELRNVSFSYDQKHPILNALNFSLAYGEFALLSGLSGEGKTTLLSVINGVIPEINPGALSGDVILGGENVTKWSAGRRARLVGSVLQNADEQIVHERAQDEVAFGCENLAMSQQEMETAVSQALARMQLSPDAPTRKLSGGQKQRLITASTLAMRQKILLLDEPLANLDRPSALHLLSTLKSLCEQGVAVLLVEHRLDLALPFVDTVYSMQNGALYAEHTPARLLTENREILPHIPGCVQSDVLISGRDLRFSVRGKEILKGVDIDVHAGEKLTILGENGCGKSTLLRLLARLTTPDCGEYRQTILPGKRRAGKEWFRQIGYVYQNPSYQLFMPTLWQEVRCSANSDADAQQMLELFGLESLRDRHPHSLSEGQKRRAGVATVCAAKPKVIFLDEPTVGQDFQNLHRMVDALCRLQKETGCALVTVTHDVRCAGALSDTVLHIDQGRIVQTGDSRFAMRYFSAGKMNIKN